MIPGCGICGRRKLEAVVDCYADCLTAVSLANGQSIYGVIWSDTGTNQNTEDGLL
jgi:hypothetical protein